MSDSVAVLVRQLASAHMGARTVHTAARLGVFEALGANTTTSDAIAHVLNLHPRATLRLLRALAALGLAVHEPPDRFTASDAGRRLDASHPRSIHNLVMLLGSERSWRSWERLERAVRSGRSQAKELYGMDGFDYFRLHPQEGRVFHAAMAEVSAQTTAELVGAIDFSVHASIVDVGGGNGELLEAMLRAAPDARGTLFDLPEALEGAERRFTAAGLAHRASVVAGSFFETVPQDHALYVLKNVLHDWEDADCVRILRQVRAAMGASSRLLIVERVLPVKVADSPADRQFELMDLNMMVTAGGRERTLGEYIDLLSRCGFEAAAAQPLGGANRFSVLEASPSK
jgi:hypothetical protein